MVHGFVDLYVKLDIPEMVSIVKILMNVWKIQMIVHMIPSALIQKDLLHALVIQDTRTLQ